MASVCDNTCKGCIYRQQFHESLPYCNYIMVTSKKRPCKAGKGCTVRRTGRKKNNFTTK